MLFSELVTQALDILWDGKSMYPPRGKKVSLQIAIRTACERTGDPNIIWGSGIDLEELFMERVGFNTPSMPYYVARTEGMDIVAAHRKSFIQPYRRRFALKWIRELKAAGM